MSTLSAFNFKRWIDEHRHLLKPPVGNQVVWPDREFIIMVVGGPNARKDYHINEGEEFFYQLEGSMVLKVVEDGEFRDIPLDAGDILLLPGGVPHSPQRYAESIGLVVERRRHPEEKDGFRWYCDACGGVVHEVFIELTDIVSQLKILMDEFWADEKKCTCPGCGEVLQKP